MGNFSDFRFDLNFGKFWPKRVFFGYLHAKQNNWTRRIFLDQNIIVFDRQLNYLELNVVRLSKKCLVRLLQLFKVDPNEQNRYLKTRFFGAKIQKNRLWSSFRENFSSFPKQFSEFSQTIFRVFPNNFPSFPEQFSEFSWTIFRVFPNNFTSFSEQFCEEPEQFNLFRAKERPAIFLVMLIE